MFAIEEIVRIRSKSPNPDLGDSSCRSRMLPKKINFNAGKNYLYLVLIPILKPNIKFITNIPIRSKIIKTVSIYSVCQKLFLVFVF